jgi:hypothetical protein
MAGPGFVFHFYCMHSMQVTCTHRCSAISVPAWNRAWIFNSTVGEVSWTWNIWAFFPALSLTNFMTTVPSQKGLDCMVMMANSKS